MAIEIRELVIKTTVTEHENSQQNEGIKTEDWDDLRQSILSECKQYLDTKLRSERMR